MLRLFHQSTKSIRMLELENMFWKLAGNIYEDRYSVSPYAASLWTTEAAKEWALECVLLDSSPSASAHLIDPTLFCRLQFA